jgi:CP family cyanate transporter-like MFS transporter
MAQSVGYSVAAVGPVLLGLLHDLTGGWTIPLLVLVALTLTQAAVGTGAGRARHLNLPAPIGDALS